MLLRRRFLPLRPGRLCLAAGRRRSIPWLRRRSLAFLLLWRRRRSALWLRRRWRSFHLPPVLIRPIRLPGFYRWHRPVRLDLLGWIHRPIVVRRWIRPSRLREIRPIRTLIIWLLRRHRIGSRNIARSLLVLCRLVRVRIALHRADRPPQSVLRRYRVRPRYAGGRALIWRIPPLVPVPLLWELTGPCRRIHVRRRCNHRAPRNGPRLRDRSHRRCNWIRMRSGCNLSSLLIDHNRSFASYRNGVRHGPRHNGSGRRRHIGALQRPHALHLARINVNSNVSHRAP